MLSPQLRRQVFELWKMFWSSGMTNPLTSIEQITYLLFIKRLESLDAERQKKGKRSIYGLRRNCQLQHIEPDDAIGIALSIPEGANPAEYEKCKGHGTCRWSYIKQTQTISVPIESPSQFKKPSGVIEHKRGPDPDEIDEFGVKRRPPSLPTSARNITPHDHLSQYVFPWLRELEHTLQDTGDSENGLRATGSRLEDAYFQLPREKTSTLQSAIKTIDDLFRQVGTRSANYDIMGDIFEYLLSEIQTSGKNGQFRTPRHIIRFMIELLDPQPGKRIVDPAAGTGGFLINSILHIRRKHTDSETVLLEWDSTPHRIYGGDPGIEEYLTGNYFTGYDNDRTMVRIGWMNMILHGIESPDVTLGDTLGKSLSDDVSGAFDFVMANPPFTGNVDKGDLNEERFPRNPRNAKEPITNKSELLFVWLMLDLLRVGGRAAVIVPEGVLFGSTIAHKELRRQLLFEHRLEGVISLPAGVFQPYTGVKTSILVFQKIGGELSANEQPRTDNVWFYEVEADGYTLDAKRNDKPEPNDLWDALEKWPDKVADSTDYYQPDLYDVRWRLVDDDLVKWFPHLAHEKENLLGIHELFAELPSDPEEATAKVSQEQQPKILDLYGRCVEQGEASAAAAVANASTGSQKRAAAKKVYDKLLKDLNRAFNDAMKQMLESGFDDFGRKALAPLLDAARKAADEEIKDAVARLVKSDGEEASDDDASSGADEEAESNGALKEEAEAIAREFAKLDGYNVKLRSAEVFRREEELSETKSWSAPVRAFARLDDWESADGEIRGSHDEAGNLRPEFVADPEIYDKDGLVKAEYLEPGCIEANDLNLSAGRYKPFTLAAVKHDPPAQIIRELQELEGRIQEGLSKLLAMVEGAE